jgi:hypothetical protein
MSVTSFALVEEAGMPTGALPSTGFAEFHQVTAPRPKVDLLLR